MNALKKAVFAATFAAAGFATSAQAALIGDEITLTGKIDGSMVSSRNATIGAGNEFTGIASYLNFNFDQDTLIVTVNKLPIKDYTFSANLGSFVFSGFDDKITELKVIKDTPKFNNFDAGDFFLNTSDNSITLNFSGVRPQNNESTFIAGIATSAGAPAASVPEPTTIALFGLGLLAVTAFRRKSGKSANA